MSETKPIYSGETTLRARGETDKAGRWIRLEIEDFGGVHPFKGYEGERFAVVIVGPLAPAEHAPPKNVAGSSKGRTSDFDSENGGSTPPPASKPKRRWQEMPPSQRAALLVRDPEFWKFAGDYNVPASNIKDAFDADEWLKAELNVKSKAEIRPGPNTTYYRFQSIEADFRTWQQARGHGVI